MTPKQLERAEQKAQAERSKAAIEYQNNKHAPGAMEMYKLKVKRINEGLEELKKRMDALNKRADACFNPKRADADWDDNKIEQDPEFVQGRERLYLENRVRTLLTDKKLSEVMNRLGADKRKPEYKKALEESDKATKEANKIYLQEIKNLRAKVAKKLKMV